MSDSAKIQTIKEEVQSDESTQDLQERTEAAQSENSTHFAPKRKFEARYFSKRKFCDKWLDIPELVKWVHPLRCDPSFIWCKFCKRKIRAHLADLKNHHKTFKHQKNVRNIEPEIPRESGNEFDEAEVVINFPPPRFLNEGVLGMYLSLCLT